MAAFDDRMLLFTAAIDGHLGIDGITQHSFFAGREGGKPSIAEIGRTVCSGLLVQRQNARRQPCFAVIGESDCRERMMLIDRGLIEINARRR